MIAASVALMVTLVSSVFSAGPFFIQSAWALPYVSSVSVSPSSTEKVKGETATYTVTVSRASGAGSGTINLSFQSSSIPSSAAHFEDSGGSTVTSVNFGNGGGNSKSLNLKIDTSSLSVEQHTFTVKGTKSNAASDSATSSSTTLTVTKPPNQLPTADAGSDQTVKEGDSVSLDGSGSSDPDGTIASYSWTQTAGESVTLDGGDTATPSFTAPNVGAAGDTLTFELTITDSDGGTDTDSVDIAVNNANQNPVADAGSDQTVNEGDNVALDGAGSSDPDGTIASYSWSQTAGESVTLDDPNNASPSFTAPDIDSAGDTLTFELTVTDNDGAADTDSVDVVVNNVVTNEAPTADAGADQTVNEGDTVSLDGSGSSDPDGDTLTYSWTQTAGVSVTLDDASSANPSFTAPDVGPDGETLTFELTVDDGNGHTDANSVDIKVNNVVTNEPPTADAGADSAADEGKAGVQLDGTASSDSDGTIDTYLWEQTDGPSVTLNDANTAVATFDAPLVTANSDLTFKLTVTDNDGATDDDTVVITINNVNQPPVASLAADPTSIEEGSTSALDASGSTDDSGITEYTFEQVGGTAGTITVDSSDPSKATFEAPSIGADETATIKVTVKDGEGATDSATAEIEVTNAAPHATTLTLNTITSVPWGKDVTVTGKLTDNDASGAGVGGATITFDGTGADNLPDVITDADGTFTAKGASSATIAKGWQVQAHYSGDSEFAGSDSIVQTYATTKHSVGMSITAAKATVPWGQPNSFTVTLTDTATGLPIQGKTVSFDGTGAISVPNAVTGSDGKAIGTGTSPNSVATGWTYQAHFAGDAQYNKKDSAIKTYSTSKHSTSLTLNLYPTTVAGGALYKVSGVLKDIVTGQAIGSKTISFTADSPITIADQTTDATGTYITKPNAPTTAGTYNIQSHFAGDDLYSAKNSPVKTLTVS